MSNVVKISAADVNKLRKLTGAGMMDCKKALQATDGDFEAAIEFLRKKGQKVAAKRADRSATEGAAIAKVSGGNGVAIVLSCETDFVAKNDDFVAFATQIADLALANLPENVDELLGLSLDGVALSDRIAEQVGKIGEKIEVSKYEKLSADTVIPYIHAGNKVAVLVALNQAQTDEIVEAGKNVAMQVAAMSPLAVDESGISQEVIDKEIEIARELLQKEGKPEHMIDKIAQGKLKRFYKDNTLLHQQYVKNNKSSVAEYLNEVSKGLTVTGFSRVAIG